MSYTLLLILIENVWINDGDSHVTYRNEMTSLYVRALSTDLDDCRNITVLATGAENVCSNMNSMFFLQNHNQLLPYASPFLMYILPLQLRMGCVHLLQNGICWYIKLFLENSLFLITIFIITRDTERIRVHLIVCNM